MRPLILLLALALTLTACADKPEMQTSEVTSDGTTEVAEDTPEDGEPDEDSDQDEDIDSEDDFEDVAELDAEDADSDTPDMGMGGECGPRWVLRDADGVEVDAWVSDGGARPRNEATFIGTLGEEDNDCITLIALEGRKTYGASFSLSTGRMQDCYTTLPDPALAPGAFPNGTCSGAPYSTFAGVSYLNLGGDMYAVSGAADYVSPASYFVRSANGDCIESANAPGYHLWQYRLAPQWITTALSNPPYSLSYR